VGRRPARRWSSAYSSGQAGSHTLKSEKNPVKGDLGSNDKYRGLDKELRRVSIIPTPAATRQNTRPYLQGVPGISGFVGMCHGQEPAKSLRQNPATQIGSNLRCCKFETKIL
jgi:hypothetical protein